MSSALATDSSVCETKISRPSDSEEHYESVTGIGASLPNSPTMSGTPTEERTTRGFKIFALTIAINNYHPTSKYHSLKGCIADAEDIESFLVEHLDVPRSNIKSLRDSTATRDGIFDAILAFETCPDIEKGDAILIFYAGHGSQFKIHKEGSVPTTAELIVPYDSEINAAGQHTHAIVDADIGYCLKRIAIQKGNNITVIFDSCHSASGTRSARGPADAYRSVHYKSAHIRGLYRFAPDPTDAPDTHGTRTRGHDVDLDSYKPKFHSVLLAACQSGEKAEEVESRGLFTQALVAKMREHGKKILEITYGELFGGMPKIVGRHGDHQNPQCEGDHANRLVFGTNVKPPEKPVEFGLDKFSNMSPIPFHFRTTDDPGMQAMLKGFEDFQASTAGTKFVRIPEPPPSDESSRSHVVAFLHDKEVHVKMNSLEIDRQFPGPEKLPFHFRFSTNEKPEFYDSLLSAISKFERLLKHGKPRSLEEGNISIRFSIAGEEWDSPKDLPISNGMINVENIWQGKSYKIVIQIDNNTGADLYPALFYFDGISLGINEIYTLPTVQAAAYEVESPLKNQQSLIIGDLNGDIHTVFRIRDGKHFEAGYLKLLFSRYFDGNIVNFASQSPFHRYRAVMPYKRPPRSSNADVKYSSITIPFLASSAANRVRTRTFNKFSETRVFASVSKTVPPKSPLTGSNNEPTLTSEVDKIHRGLEVIGEHFELMENRQMKHNEEMEKLTEMIREMEEEVERLF